MVIGVGISEYQIYPIMSHINWSFFPYSSAKNIYVAMAMQRFLTSYMKKITQFLIRYYAI